MDYKWEPGFQVAYKRQVDANVFAQRIDALRQRDGNGITPWAVVEDARPSDATTHALFEWDDSVAAEEWRIVQARNALNSLRIVVRQPGEVDRLVIANIHVREEGQHSYLPSAVVAANPELMDKAMQEALVYMRSWEARWRNFTELQPIFVALRQVEAQVVSKRATRRPRQPVAS